MTEANVRTVHFMCEQGAEDLYRCKENGRVYVRQRCDKYHVRWLTASKWSGGYESCSHMRAGITIRILNGRDNILFEETIVHKDGYDGTVADKKAPFSDEVIKQQAKFVAEQMKLKSYIEWKKMLMRSAKEHKFTGYSDNWCYDAEYGPVRPLFDFEYLGIQAYCIVQLVTHRVSGQMWERIEIRDKSKQTVLEICGYLFEEDKK